jgi:hypothetical protein
METSHKISSVKKKTGIKPGFSKVDPVRPNLFLNVMVVKTDLGYCTFLRRLGAYEYPIDP